MGLKFGIFFLYLIYLDHKPQITSYKLNILKIVKGKERGQIK